MESVETFVILPLHKFKALEERGKRDGVELRPSGNKSPAVVEENDETPATTTTTTTTAAAEEGGVPAKKDLKDTYRATLFRKLLKYIKERDSDATVTSFENLDALIRSALNTSKKTLPNEAAFFDFLFENNLAFYVRNRSKIDRYYKGDMWRV